MPEPTSVESQTYIRNKFKVIPWEETDTLRTELGQSGQYLAVGELKKFKKLHQQYPPLELISTTIPLTKQKDRVTLIVYDSKTDTYYFAPQAIHKKTRLAQITAIRQRIPTTKNHQISELATLTQQIETSISPDDWPATVDRLVDTDFTKLNKKDPEYTQELKQRQKEILKNLPSNIVDQLTAHLKEAHVYQKGSQNTVKLTFSDTKYLIGEVFEEVLNSENRIYQLDPQGDQYPQTDEQWQISERLLAFMANPKRFGIKRKTFSNPDLISLIFGQPITIVASIEAKTRLHKIKQLKKCRESLEQAAAFINSLPDADTHGLPGLGQGKNQLQVSLNYRQILAVPRDAQLIDLPDRKSLFISNEIDHT